MIRLLMPDWLAWILLLSAVLSLLVAGLYRRDATKTRARETAHHATHLCCPLALTCSDVAVPGQEPKR